MRGTKLIVAIGTIMIGADNLRVIQTPSFRSVSHSVVVDVSVTDGQRPVTNLLASDFVLLDDGVPQDFRVVADRAPLDLRLLVDVSSSAIKAPIASPYAYRWSNVEHWREDVVRRIRESLTSADRIQLVRVRSDVEGWTVAQPVTGNDIRVRKGRTALWDALAMMLISRASIDFRRAIVLVTDGRDTSSVVDRQALTSIADHSDGAIYVVALGGRASWYRGATGGVDAYDALLEDLTGRTGGELLAVAPSQKVDDVLMRLLNQLRSRYVLTYVPTNIAKAGWHQLEVQVKGRKYLVRSRRGYWNN